MPDCAHAPAAIVTLNALAPMVKEIGATASILGAVAASSNPSAEIARNAIALALRIGTLAQGLAIAAALIAVLALVAKIATRVTVLMPAVEWASSCP